jgi:hypothetical protein
MGKDDFVMQVKPHPRGSRDSVGPRSETTKLGKDTGRFWDAGASNDGDSLTARKQFEEWGASLAIDLTWDGLPRFTREDLRNYYR